MENKEIIPTAKSFEFLYGNETGIWINDEFIEDSDYTVKVEYLSVEDIIRRFSAKNAVPAKG